MLGEIEEETPSDDFDDDFDEEDAASTIVMSDDSIEINVDELVKKVEASTDLGSGKKRAVRQRLDELREQREAQEDLDGTYNFNLDDDVL